MLVPFKLMLSLLCSLSGLETCTIRVLTAAHKLGVRVCVV